MKDKQKTNNDSQSKPNKPKEKFSKRDIEELMGKHRPIYHRVKGGAIRSNK